MTAEFTVQKYFEAQLRLMGQIDVEAIERAIDLIKTAGDSEKKVITCGNGGSASTASHYITDWNKMVNIHTGKQFHGFSLCDNLGLITAYANDLSYDQIFSGQLRSILSEGDLLIAISGSGNSPNVIKAVEYANQAGATTLAIVGYDGGKLLPLAHHHVLIPSFDMQLCEDFHFIFGHMVMKSLCGSPIK
jgi:D-sedoheptulose 7-phosphate isomerase